ncbi:MAG: aminopeptidase [Spirochaetaceae bacterium]|nr:MAG: aminopeptidase [Spirochaetaceae bacterium]
MYRDDIPVYAELIVKSLNLEQGQRLLIKSEPVHWPLVNEVARKAYVRGASLVEVESEHGELYKARVENSSPDYLGFQPRYQSVRYQEMIDDGWALVSIKNPDDPDLLAGLDAARNLAARKALLEIQHPWRKQLQSDRFPWVVVAAPTPAWAAKILNTRANQDAVDRLWQIMKPILRLDRRDPYQAWVEHSDRLAARARMLDALRVAELHFAGPGTDLTVRLCEQARWIGGSAKTPAGRRFFPNIPTEEVFSAPDCRLTRGEVSVTRPVMVMGELVDRAWFRFEEGRVVECNAAQGRPALESFLKADGGSRLIGEIALVDVDSPIFRSGAVFYNILFDENAACHFALGSAYPGCIDGYQQLSQTQREALGVNESTQHTDFMVGSQELTVRGRSHDGTSFDVMLEGRFVL